MFRLIFLFLGCLASRVRTSIEIDIFSCLRLMDFCFLFLGFGCLFAFHVATPTDPRVKTSVCPLAISTYFCDELYICEMIRKRPVRTTLCLSDPRSKQDRHLDLETRELPRFITASTYHTAVVIIVPFGHVDTTN